jgi:uncharacterized membrane protein
MIRTLAGAALAAVGACVLADAALAQPPSDVGTLPGFTVSRPKAIDGHGDIVGQAARAGPNEQAALWVPTHNGYSVVALPALAGLLWGDARAFGRHGAPVGYSYLTGGVSVFRAVVWREDASGTRVAVDLEPPPGFTDALAVGANHHGLIVGEASNPRETINGSTVRHAVAWFPRKRGDYEVVDLGVPEGYDASSASGVNARGEVVGTAQRLESDGAGGLLLRATVALWRTRLQHDGSGKTATLVLPSHPDLPRNQNPAINAAGLVVAQAYGTAPGERPVSRPLLWWRLGRRFLGPYELPVPEGFTDAVPNDINELGTILGTASVRPVSGPPSASQAVEWTWSRARRRFVTRLLANPPGTALVTASGMNERGDAVGSAPLPAPGMSGGLLWRRSGRGHCDSIATARVGERDYCPGSSAEGP